MAGAMLCEQASNFMAANEFAQAMDAAMQATKADELKCASPPSDLTEKKCFKV